MAVIKINKARTQVQFIEDDHGVVYGLSVNQLRSLLAGKQDLVMASRLPHPVSDGRFKKADVWDDTAREVVSYDEARKRSIPSVWVCEGGGLGVKPYDDPLGAKSVKDRDDEKTYMRGDFKL